MPFIKDDFGQVKILWRLILSILLYTSAAVLLRFVPIRILTTYLVCNGIPQKTALERATKIILENPIWSTALGILFGLIGFLIVWLLITKIEKSKFHWKAVGLSWTSNSLLMIFIGVLLAIMIYIGSAFTKNLLNNTDKLQISTSNDISMEIFFQKLVLFIAMGFGEEIVFRGYIQTRSIKKLNTIGGILFSAGIFVLLHQIFYSLSLITLLSGLILWFSIGMLYYLSKSLYLSIAFHGVMNTLMNTLDASYDDIDSLIVHAIVLICVILAGFFNQNLKTIRRNNL